MQYSAFIFKPFHGFSLAYSAMSFVSMFCSFYIGIFSRVFMSFRTMSFSGIFCMKSIASMKIYLVSNRLKMPWVYAGSVSAKMVNNKVFGYFANNKFISEPMSINHCFADSELGVSVNSNRVSPFPAGINSVGRINLSPKPYFKRYFY